MFTGKTMQVKATLAQKQIKRIQFSDSYSKILQVSMTVNSLLKKQHQNR